MTYFSKFPLYLTTAGHQGPIGSPPTKQRQIIMTDFFRRIRVGKGFRDITIGLIPYVIKDGYTPERVAHEFYGTAFYHWVILMVNDMVNPREEWPLDSAQFNAYMADNYANTSLVHHYIDPATGYTVDSNFAGAAPVSNYDYEDDINEKKRTIKMLDSKYIQEFIAIFDKQIIK